MKIFYLGHFGGYDGHSRAARDYVELLQDNGHQVFCRTVDNEHNLAAFGEKWPRLCQAKPTGIMDVAIVHKTPWNQNGEIELLHYSEPIASAKLKVFMTVFETSKWPDNWKPPLEPYDRIITFSQWQGNAAKAILSDKDVRVVPHVVTPSVQKVERNDSLYRFYSEFSDITERKGLDILLKAFYLAFDHSDAVELHVKIPDSNDLMTKFFAECKKAERCFTWKPRAARLSYTRAYLSDEQLDRLMLKAHAYICPARGEGFSLPLARAAVNGLYCFYPYNKMSGYGWGGDYLGRGYADTGEYPAVHNPVITDCFANYGFQFDTRGMEWLEPRIDILSNLMRNAYEKRFHGDSSIPMKRLSPQAVYSKLMEALS